MTEKNGVGMFEEKDGEDIWFRVARVGYEEADDAIVRYSYMIAVGVFRRRVGLAPQLEGGHA